MATQLVAIDDFLIDCSLSETHTFESDVTEYPVESGSNITDNIRPKPLVVEMECLVSNSPINTKILQARNLTRNEGSSDTSPVDDAYELLQVIREQRKPVTIRTSLRTFENMALKNLSIPRGDHMDHLKFTATFQQIQTVENKRTIRMSIPGGGKKKKVGKPGNDSAASQILIDPILHYWFDPDFGRWRKSYIFAKWVDLESSSTVNYSKYKFNLFRGPMAPVEFAPAGSQVEIVNGVPVRTRGRASVPPLLLVPINQCQLHDFSIKTPFDGLTRPFETKRTLSGRTQ